MSSSAEHPHLPADVLFQNAFDHAAIGMALVAPDGRWLRVNRSVSEITGYTGEELMRLRFQDITHPDDVDLDVENAEKMLRGETTTYCVEKRYLHKSGSIVWAQSSVSLVREDGAQPSFFISQIQDITARKESEEKLAKADVEIKRLRRDLLKVCAWTKRIEVDGRWISIEEFLSHYLHLQLTHGMSEEAVRLFGKSPKR
ncbi:MAG TPA: PAS domain S-box protein [Chthoniobacterales bacterium]|nr:PAS domain S-box protein [Chthoniobacterales bacterium]